MALVESNDVVELEADKVPLSRSFPVFLGDFGVVAALEAECVAKSFRNAVNAANANPNFCRCGAENTLCCGCSVAGILAALADVLPTRSTICNRDIFHIQQLKTHIHHPPNHARQLMFGCRTHTVTSAFISDACSCWSQHRTARGDQSSHDAH